MSAPFDPLYKWLGIPPEEQPPHYYRLLGIRPFEANADVIEGAADRQMAYLRTFQTGPNVGYAQELLNHVAAAKVCLLTPHKKAQYDAWLAQQLERPGGISPPPVATPASEPGAPDLAEVLGTSDAYAASLGRGPLRRKRQSPWGLVLIGTALIASVALAAVVVKLKWDSSTKGRSAKADGANPVLPGPAHKAEPAPADPVREPAKEDQKDAETGEKAKQDAKALAEAHRGKKSPKRKPPRNKAAKRESSEPAEKMGDEAAPPQLQPERAAVPTEEDQAKALQRVREVFQADFEGAKRPVDKQGLAKRLLQEGIQARDDLAGQFALLQTARELAVETGDGLTAFSAVEELARLFELDGIKLKIEVLEAFAKMARTADQHKSIAGEALKLADEALAEGNAEIAAELGRRALKEAAKVRERQTVQQVRSRAKEIEELAAAYEEVQKATAVLVRKPEDPEANLVVGRYQCLLRGDWEAGLPLLVQGSDATLKALAQRELERVSVPEAQAALADEWRLLAAKTSGLARRQMHSRAALWYRKAAPGLSGPAKAAAEKWLKELGTPETFDEPPGP